FFIQKSKQPNASRTPEIRRSRLKVFTLRPALYPMRFALCTMPLALPMGRDVAIAPPEPCALNFFCKPFEK
ncbi:MAG: hypothetical protein EA390_02310, partial [Balneolaceae bacterium]